MELVELFLVLIVEQMVLTQFLAQLHQLVVEVVVKFQQTEEQVVQVVEVDLVHQRLELLVILLL